MQTPIDPAISAFLDALESRLGKELWRAGAAPLISVTLDAPDPGPVPSGELPDHSMYWTRPSEGRLRVGVGHALSLTAGGKDRFASLDARLAALEQDWSRKAAAPGFFLGFAFSPEERANGDWPPLANTLAVLPRVVLDRSPLGSRLTFSCRQEEDREAVLLEWVRGAGVILRADGRTETDAPSSPILLEEAPGEEDVWLARVHGALEEIRTGSVDKLVLTRRIRILTSRPLRPGCMLAWLRDRYPDCTLFAFRDGDNTLLGVSPERLLSLRQGTATADALAGTAPRAAAPEDDSAAGERLLHDAKAQHEHAVVVAEIRRALAPDCAEVITPQGPRLMKLPTVQHLWSQIHGRLLNGARPLSLIDRLHPTPAVGGAPRPQALAWLDHHGENRWGWYTGGVGWLDEDGAEVSVVLRCGLLNGAWADLFAGAGIVADSVPEIELDETRWKLDALRQALAIG